ncbi:MAG: sulfur carrier protein ThiS [Cyanobacteria bacterium P01_H01_bin.26]
MNNTSDSAAVILHVNGESKSCLAGTTLPQLLTQLKMDPRLVAVEYNGEILHRQFWQTTVMQPDDRLEVVTIVGGG